MTIPDNIKVQSVHLDSGGPAGFVPAAADTHRRRPPLAATITRGEVIEKLVH